MNPNIVLFSLSVDELNNLIQKAVHEGLKEKTQKELLNFKEACEFLGISSSALNTWKRQNRIPYKKLGKRIMFSREELLKALKDSKYSKINELLQK